MALYAIGDLHLSLSVDKPMDKFGDAWKNHTEKLKEGFSKVNDDDITVLCGDISWAMNFSEAKEDFRFIEELPGSKILLKGNHDYWWSTATKINLFFKENGHSSISLLHNNCYTYSDFSICGTRGWFYEEEHSLEHDKKIMKREVMRLEASLKAAGKSEKLVFLHYPPIFQNYRCNEILELLDKYSVKKCCYGHLHGKSLQYAFQGFIGCTEFRLVSADYLNFVPKLLLDTV